MKLTGLSASSFSTFSDCSFKYFLSYVLGFEDVAGAAALQGTLAHKILEVLSRASINKHYKESKVWDVNYLWDIAFNHYFNSKSNIAEQIDNAKLRKVCKGIHELLASEYTPIRDNTISAEATFYIPLEGKEFNIKGTDKQFSIRGVIDRIDKLDEETIEIIDYKSGTRMDYKSADRKKKGPIELHGDIQPKMYHLAAKTLYPWAKNFLVTFIYFTDGGAITVPFCDSDVDITKGILRDRLNTIWHDNDPQRTISWKCKHMCGYGKSGICNATWDEKEEFGIDFTTQKYTVLNTKKIRK